jgi:nucleoid-associated protein YgaU
VSRIKKIVIASFVLALGVGLAWPFRKSATKYAPDTHTDIPGEGVSGSVTFKKQPGNANLGSVESTPALGRHVAAKMASTADSGPTTPTGTGFDLENHAALVGRPSGTHSPTTAPQRQSPVTPEVAGEIAGGETRTSRPAYSTGRVAPADNGAWPGEVVHVVRNGDTLEKLAERYLGSTERALELFDLNRYQLANPHLLPIGAELRIPVPPRSESD